MTRHTERRSLIDPARLARDQVRAGLPVTVCPFCGGAPSALAGEIERGCTEATARVCCCLPCHISEAKEGRRELFMPCMECPHGAPQGGTTP